MVNKILTFRAIDLDKISFTTINVLVFQKEVDIEKVLVSKKYSR